MPVTRPSDDILTAFGADPAAARLLPGGRGTTWLAGDIVLRPMGDPVEGDWHSEVLEHLPHDADFRTARPIRSTSGAWSIDGWEAWTRMPGAADETRVLDVIAAGDAFHRAIAHLPRPDFIDAADDPWSRSDRMAWQEEPLVDDPMLNRISMALRPVASASQLIHGDLLGNVLFADPEPPTIIDWAPYWRPVRWAAAIAVADAVCWHEVPLDLLKTADDDPDWPQLVLRALAFRIATLHLAGWWDEAMRERHEPVVASALALAAR
ncbi:hypothetical protein [Microbacterium sp. NPDC057650]|uniref:hypothetical protein n=1 Tax=unclassified Microbacterium TaxID=2609290 RepID=UPI00366CFF89